MRVSGKLATGAALLGSVSAIASVQAQNAPLTVSRASVSLATAKKIAAAAGLKVVDNK